MRLHKRIGIGSLVLVLAGTLMLQAYLAQTRYGNFEALPECPWCDANERGEDVVFVPFKASIMRLAFPADPDFLGDILWMRTAYYFGKHVLGDRRYPYLLHLIDLVTDLAPHWVYPYLFGAIVLPSEGAAVDEGLYLIDKGLGDHPMDWRLWFYKGFYLWKSKTDLKAASEAILRASLLPGSPKYLARLSATLATRAGQRELAVRFLMEALSSVENPEQRKLLLEKLKEISINAPE